MDTLRIESPTGDEIRDMRDGGDLFDDTEREEDKEKEKEHEEDKDKTSWIQCTYTGSTPPWELKELPGQGYAAFATRRFAQGDLICSELPTVWVHGHHPFDEHQVKQIEERVEALNIASKTAFYDMANMFPEAQTPAVGVFMTNCFDMTDAPHGDSCAMYLALGRLNHSCTPNTQQSHIPHTGEEVLYASRDIECGEELNDCYIDLRQSTHARREALQDIYRFHCRCKACCASDTSTDDDNGENKDMRAISLADDNRRERAAAYDDRIIAAAVADGADIACTIALDAVRLLEASVCLPWSIRYLPDALITVYDLTIATGSEQSMSMLCLHQQNGSSRKTSEEKMKISASTSASLAMKKAREGLDKAHRLNILLSGPTSPETISSAAKLGLKI